MPTGYTAPIDDGDNLNARDFVRSCARAFGAFVHQREESLDSPPRPSEVKEDSYYAEQLEQARAKHSEFLLLTPGEIQSRYEEYFDLITQSNIDQIHDYRIKSSYYDQVEAKVKAWKPNAESERLQLFCLEQIESSRPYEPHLTVPIDNPGDWRTNELEYLERGIKFYAERKIEEEAHTRDTAEYGKKMLESIEDVEE